ncbi:MAG: N-acetylmuramic acid 6-phosphate etherase [Flavobacteriales bacterium]|nr:N-acetylmuramic acid 6-phosphate etherase [Flavobacteriales bacterium]|tara:strand:+ start:32931 stop:33737 length:807 start_codon:yes stop_codon:yes gene_type:complete
MNRTTESASKYDHLERMSTSELIEKINQEDQSVAKSIRQVLPQIEKVIDAIVPRMQNGGRLFYLGAGTSGRLGIVDASECPPTYGVEHGLVVGVIAGGDSAIRKAVEFAEDDPNLGWQDLQEFLINEKDTVIGIAASGTTPYVVGTLEKCNEQNILTACITCNEGTPLANTAKLSIECVVGPEFVTGSTRMKAGTAQKLILNMISTSIMIKMGKIQGNQMVDMQLSNNKLVDRGTKMVMDKTGLNYNIAQQLLKENGSVRAAINKHNE